MYKFILLACIFLIGCSSTAESKAKWYPKGVQSQKRIWRHCTTEIDGPSFHEKGICYDTQWCIKKILLKEKCKDVLLYCAYADIPCLRKNYFPAIKKRGVL